MYDNYKNKGINGLSNLGNTCFMNSVLQCMAHTYELFDIENETQCEDKSVIYDKKIWGEYFKLIHFMWENNSNISPNGFLKYVQFVAKKKNREMFTGFQQNDFSEFLLFLIDCFHNSIKNNKKFEYTTNESDSKQEIMFIENIYKNDYSEINNLFYGIQINTMYSKDNKKINIMPEQFSILSLPVPDKNNITIQDCIAEYFKPIEFTNENKYVLPDTHKDSGKKIDAIRKHNIKLMPKILILNLLRVKITKTRMIKNDNLITYEEILNMDKYCVTKNNIYELYAIGEHYGSLVGGHYTCIVKNANKKWYRYNDLKVKEINDINTNNAYTFFYRKRI